MPDETNALLDAEQVIQDLLINLQRLKQEVEGYSQAKLTLTQVQEQLNSFTAELGQLASQFRVVVDVLSKIGTPEILTQVEAVRSAVSQSAGSASTLGKAVLSGQSQVVKLVAGSKAELSVELVAVQASFDGRLRKLQRLVVIVGILATSLVVATMYFGR